MAPRALLPVISLLALVAVAPGTVGAPAVAGSVHGWATASTFQIHAGGPGGALEGGLGDWTLVCGGCFVRVTIVEGNVIVAQDGEMRALAPGTYRLSEFHGLIAHTQRAPGDFLFELHGQGRIARV